MSNTNDFNCFIQTISAKDGQPIPNVVLSFLDNISTTDENGLVIFPCSLANNEIAKTFPVIIENEQFYALYTNCNARSHHNKDNPFKLTIYTNNARIQGIGIYTKSGESFNSLYTTDIADKEIFLKARIVGKMPKKDISWKYYIKDRNEPQWSNVAQTKLLEFPSLTSMESHNIQVSFNLKDIKNLKDNQQLFIFAFFNNSAYYATYTNTITKNNKSTQEKIKRKTHAVLEISLLPTLEIRTNTIQFLHNNTNKEYNLTKSCDIDYLLNSLKDSKSYVIKCEKSTIYIKDKHTNADKAIITDSEFEAHKQKQILLDSNSLWNLRHILDSYNQQANKEISVYIKKTISWDRVKKAYEEINTIGKYEYYEIIGKGGSRAEAELAQAQKRYEKVGGKILQEFNRQQTDYVNTCAFKVSYALNNGGLNLKNIPLNAKVLILADIGKNIYFVRVKELTKFVQSKEALGDADELYNPKPMSTKQDNIDFYNCEFLTLKKCGLVAMKVNGWDNAWGHITFWDGNNFLDYDKKLKNNWLLRDDIVITEFYFWEFK